jgi:formate dehydrogenase subunit delta
MESRNVLRMANRIGEFFEPMPDRSRALADIADHIRRFWEPRMRRQILEHLDAHGAEGLGEVVWRSLVVHRAQLKEGLSEAATDDRRLGDPCE